LDCRSALQQKDEINKNDEAIDEEIDKNNENHNDMDPNQIFDGVNPGEDTEVNGFNIEVDEIDNLFNIENNENNNEIVAMNF
jgi:hypothetical protein